MTAERGSTCLWFQHLKAEAERRSRLAAEQDSISKQTWKETDTQGQCLLYFECSNFSILRNQILLFSKYVFSLFAPPLLSYEELALKEKKKKSKKVSLVFGFFFSPDLKQIQPLLSQRPSKAALCEQSCWRRAPGWTGEMWAFLIRPQHWDPRAPRQFQE